MYFFTFAVLCVLGLLEFYNKLSKRQSAIFLKIVIVWLICHDGLRWTTGTDWGPYLSFFKDCLISENEGYGKGYVLLSMFIRGLTENYTVFLLVHATIVYLILYFIVKRISPFPILSVFVFYFLMLPVLGMNRQYIALMICLIAFYYLIKGKRVIFFGCIALAMTFHVSSFLFISVYFMNRYFKTKLILIAFIVAFIINQSGLLNSSIFTYISFLGASTSEKLDYYNTVNSSSNLNIIFVILGICKRLLWVLILLIFRKDLEQSVKYFDMFLNISCLSVIFYILVANLPLQIILARAFVYFGIFEIFTIPIALTALRSQFNRQILIITMIFYGLYNINSGMSYYSDGHFDIFNPYNAVYMDGYESVRRFMLD